MKKFRLLLLLFILPFFFLSKDLSAQVLDPDDPLVRWEEGDPVPSQPAFGQIGKWVATQVVNWDTEDFKPYIFKGMPFRLMFPKNYDPNKADGYPIVVMFHGRGEAGEITNNERQLIHGAQKHRDAINNGTYDGFLLFGQNTGGWWNNYLYSVINELVTQKMPQEINLDVNRVFVHGLSSGGIGVWEMIINYPLFAASALPMSASSSYQNNVLNTLKFTPMWIFQGSVDNNPPPERTTSQVNALLGLGADVKYTIYDGVGHGTWNRAYNESDFFPFMNRSNKVNPWVLYGQSEFCPGEAVNVTIGLTAGFNGYEWRKDGVVISGATGNTINVTEYGVYDARVKRGNQWSYWSPAPVEIKVKDPTVTPPIQQLNSFESKVIPSPDGSNEITLVLPEGYETYQWKKVGNNSVIGTSRTLVVNTPGEYIASVSEFNGCSSNFSDPFLVVDANGSNGPDGINGLVAYAPSKTTAQLNWSDNPNATNNETGFEIYRSESTGGPYTLVGITDVDQLSYLDEDLNPDTEYYYIIRPVNDNAAGPTSTEVSVRTQVDNQAPTAPLNLQAISTNNNSITLQWEASTDNVGINRYDIYQNGVKAVVTESTSAIIYNLVEGQVYNFVVKARDVTGNESAASNQVTAVAINSGLTYSYYEGSFGNLDQLETATPVKTGTSDNFDLSPREQNTNIAFKWEGMISLPVDGEYTFYTESDDGSELFINGTQIVFNDYNQGMKERSGNITLTSGSYPIKVTWRQGGGGYGLNVRWMVPGMTKELIPTSALKDDFQMPGLPPEFPTNLTAIAISYEQIDLTWTDNSSNETGFQVYRASNAAGPFYPITITSPNVTSYSDNGLDAESTYYYKVLALGDYGNSGFSDEINSGLNYSYYESNFSNLDQLESATPVKTGIATDFSLSPREQNTSFAFKWEGSINIPEDGDYTFYTRSDDGSELFINGTQVVFNDYNQGMTERNGTINLTAGNYPIKVWFRQGGGGYGLEVRWQSTNINKQFIPESALKDPDVNATTFILPPAPAAPSNVLATALTNSSIKIDWTDNSADEQEFEIYRSTNNNTNFLLYRSLPANTTSFIDEDLFSGLDYYYKVVSVNVGGSSESEEVMSRTLNNIPELTVISDQSMRFNTSLELNLYAEDIDGNALIYSTQNLPSFGELFDYGDGTGQLVFNPTELQQGTYNNITIIVDDQNGGLTSFSFSLIVDDNYQPVLNQVGNQTISEGNTLSIPLTATDQNNSDILTWDTEGLPPFASLTTGNNGEADLLLEPGLSDLGTYTIRVSVSDGKGGEDSETINIIVEDTPVGYSIFLNFNGPEYNASSPWNNTHKDPVNGDNFGNLVDDQGNTTSIGVITSDFGTNTLGSTSNNGIYPANVMRTAYWSNKTETITVYGLDNALTYDFVFFGSRNEGSTTNRNTVYTINNESVTLNASRNSAETVELKGISPDINGEVNITLNRANGSAYLYLNALEIKGNYDDGTVPVPPRNLSISSVTGETVELSWLDAAYNEKGYEIYRSIGESGPFDLLNPGGTASDVTSYTDNTVSGSTTYFYKIKAFNDNGISDFSEAVSVTTPNASPVLSPIGAISAKTEETTTINITASDGDPADILTLSATNLPSFVTFVDNGNGSGDLIINPTSTDAGTYEDIIISVEDNNGSIDSENISINISSSELVSIFVNFNNDFNESSPWNNTAGAPTSGRSINNLQDESNTGTGINLTLLDGWSGDNSLGINTGNNSGVYPDNVIKTAYWESTTNNKRIRLSNLSSDKKYNFIFFASRDGGGDRTTVYSIGSESVSLNASYNSTNTVQINGVSPNNSDEITINMRKANGASYGYINALIIQSYDDNGLPLAPTDMVSAGVSNSKIDLGWVDNSDNETGFEIWRSSSADGSFSLLHTTGSNVTNYSDVVATNSTFYYKVRAINAFGNSSFTEIAGASTISFTVSVNFNAENPAGEPWNNFNSDPFPGITLNNLLNDGLNNTGISIELVESNPDFDEFSFGFDGTNPFGMVTGDDSGIVPDNVMRSTYWMDPNKAAQFKISGLNLAFSYNFVFFASRNGSGNRSTDYIIDDKKATLNASYNTSNTVQINGVRPDGNGEVVVTVATSPGSSFGYIGGLILQAYPQPQINGGSNARNASSSLAVKDSNAADQNFNNNFKSQVNMIYPNPFTDKISVSMELHAVDRLNINIRDITGKLIFSKEKIELENGMHDLSLDVGENLISSGIYFMEIESLEMGSQVYKLIKE
ncbi:PA14 domain-containing protein [Flexithrix dorotheae]|uniref:PA14 domain-containing protein n=1 Tax=Flexithrix dorotheae TaxID=70993 RepID=UPI000372B2E9|nr:PA14 domain-containing protein [Flexithrix dorotheae]